ncbi:MAG: single-stranded-DNA-specific exonuclease RecJ [Cyanobacteria bacterium J069]|nr:MAG: single-stranded-DNA-specific exonuclease RecJ [Cyanobacteria bacterium J069]
MAELAAWQLQLSESLPAWFVQAVQAHGPKDVPEAIALYAAQLLWQRGIRDQTTLAGWLDPNCYTPASPFAFGEEMHRAVTRLKAAWEQQEAIAIWGDFDADGITATSVLWEGLGQFFPQSDRLTYVIPNRLIESHGLSHGGIERLAATGVRLIVTCDTGSTNLDEIEHANRLGLDVIVTDHHTLPAQRPPVTAIINPRSLPPEHPLATLSGVAVAYKLVEALYATLPEVPTRPLNSLLDLVAIGLIADLVELRGDCRYLAQRGITQLQQNQDVATAPRPGVAMLLEFCKRTGDRPTDISFGLGPRINAISRIQGDARDGVELLTSQDESRCRQLAEATELANTRRRTLQQDLVKQVTARLSQMDLSTTSVIVLEDPQWSVGVLGLVAGQIAQEYGRPTILLSSAAPLPDAKPSPQTDSSPNPASSKASLLARGSARSVNQIDLYELVSSQQHLLTGFGGHPLAAGLSLPVDNIPLFTEGINRQLRQQSGRSGAIAPVALRVDLTVTVGELGKELFQALKMLEPCGMGNPAPNLLIRQCRFENIRQENIRDFKQRKVRYIKTEFEIADATGQFHGVWWGHYRDEIPPGWCDVVVQLDANSYRKRYEVRLMAVRPATAQALSVIAAGQEGLLDWRGQKHIPAEPENALVMRNCPTRWDDFRVWLRQARHDGTPLAIAYNPPPTADPLDTWQTLVGLAKYLSRTGQIASRAQLLKQLGIGDRPLRAGIRVLQAFGMTVTALPGGLRFAWDSTAQPSSEQSLSESQVSQAMDAFVSAVEEEQFQQRYFATVSIETIRAIATQLGSDPNPVDRPTASRESAG